jgi:hypothetical protein
MLEEVSVEIFEQYNGCGLGPRYGFQINDRPPFLIAAPHLCQSFSGWCMPLFIVVSNVSAG